MIIRVEILILSVWEWCVNKAASMARQWVCRYYTFLLMHLIEHCDKLNANLWGQKLWGGKKRVHELQHLCLCYCPSLSKLMRRSRLSSASHKQRCTWLFTQRVRLHPAAHQAKMMMSFLFPLNCHQWDLMVYRQVNWSEILLGNASV